MITDALADLLVILSECNRLSTNIRGQPLPKQLQAKDQSLALKSYLLKQRKHCSLLWVLAMCMFQ